MLLLEQNLVVGQLEHVVDHLEGRKDQSRVVSVEIPDHVPHDLADDAHYFRVGFVRLEVHIEDTEFGEYFQAKMEDLVLLGDHLVNAFGVLFQLRKKVFLLGTALLQLLVSLGDAVEPRVFVLENFYH